MVYAYNAKTVVSIAGKRLMDLRELEAVSVTTVSPFTKESCSAGEHANFLLIKNSKHFMKQPHSRPAPPHSRLTHVFMHRNAPHALFVTIPSVSIAVDWHSRAFAPTTRTCPEPRSPHSLCLGDSVALERLTLEYLSIFKFPLRPTRSPPLGKLRQAAPPRILSCTPPPRRTVSPNQPIPGTASSFPSSLRYLTLHI